MRHWHLAHGARNVSLCGAVNIELVRVSIWVRRCCHIENSDSIYFYLFSMYGPPRTPPPIYYHFPPQLSVLLAWIINVDYQIVFLVIHFPFQLFWLQILIKVSGFAMQYRFVRVFWRQPPGLMSMPINFIASRHSFLNLLFQYCRLRRERREWLCHRSWLISGTQKSFAQSISLIWPHWIHALRMWVQHAHTHALHEHAKTIGQTLCYWWIFVTDSGRFIASLRSNYSTNNARIPFISLKFDLVCNVNLLATVAANGRTQNHNQVNIVCHNSSTETQSRCGQRRGNLQTHTKRPEPTTRNSYTKLWISKTQIKR